MDMDGMLRQGCSGCGGVSGVWQATRPQKHKLPIKLECFAGCPQQQRGASPLERDRHLQGVLEEEGEAA